VLGGFAEVSVEGLNVLTETASSIQNIDRSMISSRIADAPA
jgi:F0F1-type ATP synthase epsilon subunit